MTKPDPFREHANLLVELADIRRLCKEELATMSVQVARMRNNRLIEIEDRLKTLEKRNPELRHA
jgi:hypothetical protein